MIGVEIRVLGRVELVVAGAPVELPPQQARALAVLAAAGPGRGVSRRELVTALWGEPPPGDALSVALSRLRRTLRPAGLTVSSGRRGDHALVATDGADPSGVLDKQRFARLVEDGERLLLADRPVDALPVLRAAARLWRGIPFTVDAGWSPPVTVRLAVERAEGRQERLARVWARVGLLTDDGGALEWIRGDPRLRAASAGDADIWLLEVVAALAEGAAGRVRRLLEARRGEFGHDAMTARAWLLSELVERGATVPSTPVPGVRELHAACDGADDLAPWRTLLRDAWAVALRDPGFPHDTHRAVLGDLVASPRPRSGAGLAAPVVSLLAAIARRVPTRVVIAGGARMTPVAAALLDEVRAASASSRVEFSVAGGGPAGPGAGGDRWVAAAALTAADGDIDVVVVAKVLGHLGVDDADEGLGLAVRRGVVSTGPRFVSAGHRDAVLAALAGDPRGARLLHAAVFAVLSGSTHAPAVLLAEHTLAARPELPDATIAAACLAAATAERSGRRPDAAVDLAVRGLALTDDPELRFALQLVQGDARHDRAEMLAAASAYRAAHAEAVGHPARRAVAAVRLARRWSDPGRVDRSLLALLDSSRAELAGSTEPELVELRLQLDAHVAHKSTLSVTGGSGVALARATLADLGAVTSPAARCEVLTECRWALFDAASPAEIRGISAQLESAAADAGSAHFDGEALIAAVIDHLRLGELTAAYRAVERHRDHVTRTGQGLGAWLQLTADSLFDLWNGRLAEAEHRITGEAREFLDGSRADVSDSLRQTWMGQVFWLRREQGRMAELVSGGIGRLAEHRQFFPIWSAGVALMQVELGRIGAAADQIRVIREQTDDLAALPRHGWAVPTLALLAEAVDGLARRDHDVSGIARRIDGLLAPHDGEIVLAGWPTVLLGPVARARGQLALVLGDPDAAMAHSRDGIRAVGPAAAQLAWLRCDLARALLATSSPGRRGEARELLGEVVATADERGMAALARLAREVLGSA